jgi:hypothetical protein
MKSSRNVFLFFSGVIILVIVSCNDFQKNKSHQEVSNASIRAGKKLAIQYCGSCHQFPEPSLLDTKTWENGVLPQMGPRLGIFFYFRTYPSYINDSNIGKNFYPSQPVISYENWQHIIDYYTATSPDSLLPGKKKPPVQINNNLFHPIQPLFKYNIPATSFTKFRSDGTIIMCDAIAKKLFVFNNALQLIDSAHTDGSVTDVIGSGDSLIICNTGVLNPNNGKFGSIEKINLSDTMVKKTFFKNLMRPVQITSADLNNDGKNDYIICEFGNLKGALSWLENKGNDEFEYHLIRPVPGAIHTYTDDYNHDGLPDIWALFSQGDEGVFLFTNKGNGAFDAKQVLRFAPSYGSSSFELDDFNKDGFPDIVYTCGDNADFSPVLKPYHGVYIFLNDGKNNFSEKYFYPVNGCYKAIARDFDNDGDLDIATISFFADYAHQPEEGFIYLKNNGNFNFQSYSVPSSKYGRWLTMDAGDFDEDGKIDLILGNFSFGGRMLKSSVDWTKQPPFLILKNIQ